MDAACMHALLLGLVQHIPGEHKRGFGTALCPLGARAAAKLASLWSCIVHALGFWCGASVAPCI